MRFRLARDDEAKGSYTYPNTSEDQDFKDVLKNKLNSKRCFPRTLTKRVGPFRRLPF